MFRDDGSFWNGVGCVAACILCFYLGYQASERGYTFKVTGPKTEVRNAK